MGRPSEYSESVADLICEQIAAGESVRSICKNKHSFTERTIYNWLSQNEGFVQKYARAKEHATWRMLEEIIEIADERGEDVNRSRLQYDARKWAMSKLAPKKYGDRLTHAGDASEPLAMMFCDTVDPK